RRRPGSVAGRLRRLVVAGTFGPDAVRQALPRQELPDLAEPLVHPVDVPEHLGDGAEVVLVEGRDGRGAIAATAEACEVEQPTERIRGRRTEEVLTDFVRRSQGLVGDARRI